MSDKFKHVHPLMHGHGDPCYYCGEPVDCLAGNPGMWPIGLPHADEPGRVKYHHMVCVSVRLEVLEDLMNEIADVGVPFDGVSEYIRERLKGYAKD